MKKKHFLIVIVLAIFTLSSCLKDDAQPTPQALVTLLNAYPDETGIYYRMDGNSISQYNGDFKGLTYFRAYPGNRKLEVLGKMDNKAVIDTTMSYADSTVYTGYVYGTAGKPKFIRTTDLPINNDAEKAAVRFIQLGNGIGKVTLKIGDQEVAAFKDRVQETKNTVTETQIFRPVTSGTFTISVLDEEGAVLVTRENILLKNGYYYTFALMGTKGDTGKPLYIGYF
ncbi:DUF4397 domain-containing protein [Sphingobacteruim zhuxiongii]|nr:MULTISPECIES: DUF4397 domain-containing protein [unclassified Sphingobacterium]